MSAPQRHAEDIAVGDELPVAVKRASRAQLFLYSAATWNPHRIHYDREYAINEGYPDIIVHGPLQGAWITQYFTDWAGPRGRSLRFWREIRRGKKGHLPGSTKRAGDGNRTRIASLEGWNSSH